MRRHVNLMSESARFRAGARVSLRRWALVLATIMTMLTPISIWRWQECQRIRHEHEALEASYAPIRRLNDINTELRTAASSLVRDERITLELSRRRPVATLLGIVSAATAATNGALFIERINLTQTPPGAAAGMPGSNVLKIEAACPPQFDISIFVDALKQRPFSEVKITSDDLASSNGVDRKTYTIECRFSPPAGKDSHAS
jgi:hypothetical protein